MSTEVTPRRKEELQEVTIRFAGDSGDGMQLTGTQFTNTAAVLGNDVSTLPDFPAEIRAPAGTTYGVSGFQIHFSSFDIHTPGDAVDALVVMNPAALKVNLEDLRENGILIINEDSFTEQNLKLAGYAENPLEDNSLTNYRVFRIPVTKATLEALEELGMKGKDAARSKNFYALGVVLWLYNRPLEPTLDFINKKFKNKPEAIKANERALRAGWYFGETAEFFTSTYDVPKAELPAGQYRKISGNEALAYGLIAAAVKSGKPLFYGSYPITPASDILHELAKHKNFGVKTFQAEDEIAAVCSCIGASFGGALSVTGTSGPGIALKAEAMGLGVMMELPFVVVNVQRGGPSTGLPTKTEQSDLNQVLYGRNGECPMPVIAAKSPSDCFHAAFEACKISMQHMVPVVLLTDAYLANGAEPWNIPDASLIPEIEIEHPTEWDGEFTPYRRDERGVRPWALPGTPGLQHRLGGLEKKNITGGVNYDPDNHELMIKLRQEKIDKIADEIPPATVTGNPEGGELLIVTWGGPFGTAFAATNRQRSKGRDVSHLHLRWLNPMPSNVEEILRRYKKVIVAEINMGQLINIIRSKFLIDAKPLNKMKGRPFTITEVEAAMERELGIPSEPISS